MNNLKLRMGGKKMCNMFDHITDAHKEFIFDKTNNIRSNWNKDGWRQFHSVEIIFKVFSLSGVSSFEVIIPKKIFIRDHATMINYINTQYTEDVGKHDHIYDVLFIMSDEINLVSDVDSIKH